MTYQTTLFSQLDPDVPLDPNVVLLPDPRWNDCLAELATSSYCVIDTEFYGPWTNKKDIDYWKATIRLIQIGLKSGRVLILDLGGVHDDRAACLKAHQTALGVLRRVVEDSKVPKAGMHLSTEYLLLRIHHGMKMRCTRDVGLMSQVIWAGIGSKRGRFTEQGYKPSPLLKHSLQAICERLKIPIDKTEQTSDWAGKLSHRQLNYAARDVIVPYEIWSKLTEMAREAGLMKTIQAEADAQPAFCECSYQGLPIDMDVAREDLSKWEKVCEDFLAPWKAKFPDVNPASPFQVATALSVELGKSFFVKKTIRGKEKDQPVTSDDALVPYQHLDYINSLLEWRSTTSCMNWLKTAVEYARDDGSGYRIRTNLRQISGGYQDNSAGDGESGRGMGRSSASKPINLQNPSNLQPAHEIAGAPSVRRCIRPADGRAFIVADLSQAHWRIAAQWSQDPIMCRDLRAGIDAHLAMTHRLLANEHPDLTFEDALRIRKDKSDPLYKKLNSRRQSCKSTNYAKLNLSGIKTLQRQLQTMPIPVMMSDEEAGELIEAWNDLYSVLFNAQRRHIRQVNSFRHSFEDLGIPGEYGESRALTGRRLFLVKEWKQPRERADGTWSSGYWSVKATDAVSSLWMMTEADIMKRAIGWLIPIFDAHPEWGWTWANVVHDEIDGDCKKEYAAVVAETIQTIMHKAMIWGGLTDIPVDDLNAKPEALIKKSWADK